MEQKQEKHILADGKFRFLQMEVPGRIHGRQRQMQRAQQKILKMQNIILLNSYCMKLAGQQMSLIRKLF